MSGVETMNIASTVSSVTPRIFNFAGTSGLQTINVGAANAKVELKNVNDTGLTVNLSGQTRVHSSLTMLLGRSVELVLL